MYGGDEEGAVSLNKTGTILFIVGLLLFTFSIIILCIVFSQI